jgi:exodeoxyribonuclease VII large subunit
MRAQFPRETQVGWQKGKQCRILVDMQPGCEYPNPMSQMPLFEPAIWSVSNLTRYIRGLLENDSALQDVWVEGEVSNVSRPASGHLYFTIKDRGASLRAVMWRSNAARQAYTMQEGDAVEVHGSIGVYDVGGNYQLYADLIRPAGQGILYQEFLRLKEKLESEGLFDIDRKRPLPAWPSRIGIITSATGAALRDMLHTLQRRYPLVQVLLAASPVQGDEAPGGLVAALDSLHRQEPRPDVILIARGGGSIEDLWAFNDERVARAVADSEIPVISGVGHETDFTIVDFVADLRAPTPTAAAELATPDREELQQSLDDFQMRLLRQIQITLDGRRQLWRQAAYTLRRSSPLLEVRIHRQRLDDVQRQLHTHLRHTLQMYRVETSALARRVAALSPQAVLNRGYAVVRKADGQVVRSPAQVSTDERLQVNVSDGEFPVRVDHE